MKPQIRLIILVLIAAVVVAHSTEPPQLARSQAGEPRFSFPGAGRFKLTSCFQFRRVAA